MQQNIHAYTEPGADYPAYVSINRDHGGRLTITVRGRGNDGRDVATIEMTPEQLEHLAVDVIAGLNSE